MTHAKNISARLAEESQLLAEERWLIETLTKIKSQRNALQIEQMQLVSMRRQELARLQVRAPVESEPPLASEVKASPEATPSISQYSASVVAPHVDLATSLDDPSACNQMKLNLTVINDLDKILEGIFVPEMESDEEEEEEEVDMGFFMNGPQS